MNIQRAAAVLVANRPTGSAQYQELREAIDYIQADAERIARALAVLDAMERPETVTGGDGQTADMRYQARGEG